jgi:hypothetical protein
VIHRFWCLDPESDTGIAELIVIADDEHAAKTLVVALLTDLGRTELIEKMRHKVLCATVPKLGVIWHYVCS